MVKSHHNTIPYKVCAAVPYEVSAGVGTELFHVERSEYREDCFEDVYWAIM